MECITIFKYTGFAANTFTTQKGFKGNPIKNSRVCKQGPRDVFSQGDLEPLRSALKRWVTWGARPLFRSCNSPRSFSIKGMAKENVFPVPVRACAIKSFPLYTWWNVFACIGNRKVTPRAVNKLTTLSAIMEGIFYLLINIYKVSFQYILVVKIDLIKKYQHILKHKSQ